MKIAFQSRSGGRGLKIRLGRDQGSKIKAGWTIRVRRLGLGATRVRRLGLVGQSRFKD